MARGSRNSDKMGAFGGRALKGVDAHAHLKGVGDGSGEIPRFLGFGAGEVLVEGLFK